ncbi:MAG: hypothetical protein AB7K52_00105 [Phycisphaerales bacterium]
MNSRIARVSTLVALAAGAAFTLSTPVLAQPGGGGGGGPGMRMMFGGPGGGGGMEPAVTSEQLEKYAQMLRLGPDQHDAAKALFDGYFAAHQARATKAREAAEAAREEFRESRDPSVFQEMGEKMRAFREEGQKAEKQLFDDIKSVLNPDQMDAWTKVERAHRRESGMRRSPFSVAGERADVIVLVERLELDEQARASLQPVLDTYAEELDREIVKRDELREKSEGVGQQAFRMFRPGAEQDPAAMAEVEKSIKENREAMMRVRDVNRKYARQLESMLPPEASARFSKDFKRASFPDIYREQFASRVIAAAEKMELSNEAMDSLRAIRESYERDSAALSARAETVQEETEANFTLAGMMGGRNNEKMQELRTERRNIEDTAIKKVHGLLTPEQIAKLPERREEDGRGDRMQRRQRDGNQDGNRQRRGRQGDQPEVPPGGF